MGHVCTDAHGRAALGFDLFDHPERIVAARAVVDSDAGTSPGEL
jgi:hypothetical protein